MLILCIIPSLWNMKKNQDSKVDTIDQLMHRYPHLRVAYIDTVRLNRTGASTFYSVFKKVI